MSDKTVKVRIAVAVDPDGDWYAAGWSISNGAPNLGEAMDAAIDGVQSGASRYWIEAELSVPSVSEVPTVQAKVGVEQK